MVLFLWQCHYLLVSRSFGIDTNSFSTVLGILMDCTTVMRQNSGKSLGSKSFTWVASYLPSARSCLRSGKAVGSKQCGSCIYII